MKNKTSQPASLCFTMDFIRMTVYIPMNLNKISRHSRYDFGTQENRMNFKQIIFILLQMDFVFDSDELQELKLKLNLP